MTEHAEQGVQIRAVWDTEARGVPLPVNQFIFNVGIPSRGGEAAGGDVILTFGFMNSPLLIQGVNGTEVQGVGEAGAVPVHAVGHFSFTRERIEEFRDVLTSWLDGTSDVVAQ